jgi:hypothetical protein
MPVMKKHIPMLVTVIVALTAAHPFESMAADAAARAATVLTEARKALGGEDRLRAVKTLHASGEYRRSMADTQMEGELDLMLELPDKLRRDETIGMPGGATMVRTEVLNGTDVWEDSSQRGGMGGHMTMVMRGPGGREMTPDEIRERRRQARRADLDRYILSWLLTTDAVVTHAGVAEAPDGTADVLEIDPAAGPAMRLFIDQRTRLPLMLTWQGPQPRTIVRRVSGGPPHADEPGREAEGPPPQAVFELRFDEHRSVDGIRLPHHMSRAVNGSITEEWTVRNYKVNTSFKNSTFTK